MGKKRKEDNYIITTKFVPTPNWQKEYKEGMDIFIRMLERALKESQSKKETDVAIF